MLELIKSGSVDQLLIGAIEMECQPGTDHVDVIGINANAVIRCKVYARTIITYAASDLTIERTFVRFRAEVYVAVVNTETHVAGDHVGDAATECPTLVGFLGGTLGIPSGACASNE